MRETSEQREMRILKQASLPTLLDSLSPISVPALPPPVPWKITDVSTLKCNGIYNLGSKVCL